MVLLCCLPKLSSQSLYLWHFRGIHNWLVWLWGIGLLAKEPQPQNGNLSKFPYLDDRAWINLKKYNSSESVWYWCRGFLDWSVCTGLLAIAQVRKSCTKHCLSSQRCRKPLSIFNDVSDTSHLHWDMNVESLLSRICNCILKHCKFLISLLIHQIIHWFIVIV